MTQKTRAVLKSDKDSLLDAANPKVSKAAHKVFLEDVLDSVPTALDDAPLWMLPVQSFGNTPPGVLTNGLRYLVGASPSGAWSAQALKLAVVESGAWAFYTVPNRAVFPSAVYNNYYYVREGARTEVRQWEKSTMARLPGDTSEFGDVLSAVTATRMDIRGGYSYRICAQLIIQSTDTGTGVWLSLNADAAVGVISWKLTTLNAAGADVVQRSNAFLGGAATDGVPAANTSYLVTLEAVLHNPSADTQVYLMMASGTDGQGVRMMTGSFIELTSYQ